LQAISSPQSENEVADGGRSPLEEGWRHSWDATRKKLFDLALEHSKFGHDVQERKMSRAERHARPILRRMDSMDFLDEGEEKESEKVGRALR
jgi:hypothetical protein